MSMGRDQGGGGGIREGVDTRCRVLEGERVWGVRG